MQRWGLGEPQATAEVSSFSEHDERGKFGVADVETNAVPLKPVPADTSS
jgi:hypothetical protein